MRLGVDGWRIHGYSGVPRYLINIVDCWSSSGNSGTFDVIKIFTPSEIDRSQLRLHAPVEEKLIPSRTPQIIWQNAILSRECDTDVLWCPAYVTPIHCRAKIVVTTHDATNAIHPELYRIGDRIFYRHFYAWCARRATLVITNNNQTGLDIQKYYNVPSERIRVVPPAPAKIFHNVKEDNSAISATQLHLVGDDRPYFLSVGKISTRRNVPLVIEGYAKFREETGLPHRLVVVGRGDSEKIIDEMKINLGLSNHLVHIEYVSDEELLHLYQGTEGFVTAATYEANSFTTLEAQACGAPVIIPDVPGMRQMTNKIAVILSRVSSEDISGAMACLATDKNLRRRLSEEGRQYASSFSWEQTSQKVLAVLEEAANMPNPKILE